MGQFTVYRNPKRDRHSHIPYLLDLQAPLLDTLPTRLVAPLILASRFAASEIARLHPRFEIEGRNVVMATTELGAVAARELREEVTSLATQRDAIIGAVDFLFIGY